jgi:large subunit ribosomal protein L25
MDMVTLSTATRSTDISARQLRRTGVVPCVVYGNKTENVSFQCDIVALTKAYTKAGESTLVELDLGGKKVPVLFHEVKFDPISDNISHVDFYAVDMNKEVEADVAIHFEGESQAVKEGGILVTTLDSITVRCLPKNLPHNLPIDLSKLVSMESQLTVADITVPAGVTLLSEPDAVIAIVQEPRPEEVEEAPAADAAAAATPAEGAAAPAAEGEKKD